MQSSPTFTSLTRKVVSTQALKRVASGRMSRRCLGYFGRYRNTAEMPRRGFLNWAGIVQSEVGCIGGRPLSVNFHADLLSGTPYSIQWSMACTNPHIKFLGPLALAAQSNSAKPMPPQDGQIFGRNSQCVELDIVQSYTKHHELQLRRQHRPHP